MSLIVKGDGDFTAALRIPMRGYELVEGNNRSIRAGGYASPWGVMRLTLLSCVTLKRQLRIPMRGYEIHVLRLSTLWFWVTHPHEGLWVQDWQTVFPRRRLLRIPMRGYELRIPSLWIMTILVTHPHEGLWDQEALYLHFSFRVTHPHEGLWAIKEYFIRCAWLVTHPHEGLWDSRYGRKWGYCYSYASPWGVMSTLPSLWIDFGLMLRIPMRGYELLNVVFLVVPDSCYASPWGVMRVTLPYCSSE